MNSIEHVSGGTAPYEGADRRSKAVSIADDGRARSRYDSPQMVLHWATAVLVVVLYSLAQVWGFFGKPTRNELVEVHISLGVLLAGVVLARILWRSSFARRLPATETGLMRLAAKLGHAVLYLLLVAVVGLGFCMHWAAAGQVSFFDLFAIPSPYPVNNGLAHQLLPFHFWLVSGNCGCFGGIPRASFITQPAGWWICGQHKRVAHNPTAATSAEAEISSATTAGIFTPHRG